MKPCFVHDEMKQDEKNASCEQTELLQPHAARLVACNGDCGSIIAVIINQCVNGTVMCYNSCHKSYTTYLCCILIV